MRLVSFVFLLFIGATSMAETVSITGTAMDFAGKKIVLLTYTDHFSKNLAFLQETMIADDGLFELTLEANQVKLYRLECDKVHAHLYAEPGRSYTINFLVPAQGLPRNFAAKTKTDISFVDLDEADINNQISTFNTFYDDYFEEHYEEIREIAHPVARGEMEGEELPGKGKEQLFREFFSKFEHVAKEKFPSTSSAFFNEHVNAVFAKLNLINLGLSRGSKARARLGEVYDTYLNGHQLNLNNPEQVVFLGEYFRQCRSLLIFSPEREFLKAFGKSGNKTQIMSTIEEDSLLRDTRLKSIFAIETVMTLWSEARYDKQSLSNILKEFALDEDEMTSALAHNVRVKSIRHQKGFEAQAFKLRDVHNEWHSLSDFQGKPICLGFWTTWSRSCQKELAMIDQLEEKYGKEIQFIMICLDDKKEDMDTFLRDQSSAKGLHLYGGDDFTLKSEYEVIALPTFYIIDNKGDYEYVHCPRPSEGLENQLAEVMKKLSVREGFTPGQKRN